MYGSPVAPRQVIAARGIPASCAMSPVSDCNRRQPPIGWIVLSVKRTRLLSYQRPFDWYFVPLRAMPGGKTRGKRVSATHLIPTEQPVEIGREDLESFVHLHRDREE